MRNTWGYSSAGRALEWHSRGQRFDPAYLHQDREKPWNFSFQGFSHDLSFVIVFGPVAQLGERSVRIHSETHPTQVCGPVFLSDLLDFPLKIEYLRNPKFATFFARKVPIWARSSAGRALRSHRRGRGFDPLRVHQIRNHLSENWGDFSFDHRNTTDGFQKIFGWRVVTLARRPILWI